MGEYWQSLDELLNRQLFSLGDWSLSLHRALTFLVILAIAFGLSLFLQRMVDLAFRRRELKDEGTQAVVKRLLHYLILLIGLGVGLETVGVKLTALFTAGAVFAVAIGFAMQTILQNFVSGVILLVERSIKPGDILDIEGMRVKVVSMGIRTTVVRTLDEEDLILPNTLLSQSMVTNFTLRDTLYRVRVPVGVSYGSDMRQVMDVLKASASGLPGMGHDRDPVVLLTEFGSSSVNFEISVWTNNSWAYRQTVSRLNERIWWDLKEAGITIAFPQLDVHFDVPVEQSLQAMQPAVSPVA